MTTAKRKAHHPRRTQRRVDAMHRLQKTGNQRSQANCTQWNNLRKKLGLPEVLLTDTAWVTA